MTGKQPVLLMAGGTGGHIFPALAVARLLQQSGYPVEWLGSSGSMEAERVPAAGLPFHALAVSGLRGKGYKKLFLAPFLLLRSVWQAMVILRRVKPCCVVGFGGFASGPGGIAAWLLGIPLSIHEQNALPGMTNRILARLARHVFTAFPQAFAHSGSIRNKVICVGNPVRAELLQLAAPTLRYAQRTGPLRLLVIGGSLGAQVFNERLPQALSLLPPDAQLWVRHQCGAGRATSVQQLYQHGWPEGQVEVQDFIDDMAAAFDWADLVVCRAGALTVSELAAVGVASVLVPFPFAVDDHQTHNAHFLADAGAAVLLPQKQLSAASLAELLGSLWQREQLVDMAEKARQLARPDAGEQLIKNLLKDVT
ncbi:undecaprenyldiphospho-muramoylpentapeptide beta-N-acetylglucosaminyltransferase [Marinospirillum alkaliphilum]|uniref:UDP-N-acetylglucosamine--N-acetylmuramyl-(pentapeptide) pyrophosphoryl-undecaprenol N-acetylglucosamine transferase n=1 Tax=Marinospirillum alkaliphilum DSM 21637 TaxID=1122209 RepID=A0A1K1TQY3_9GAMM|nr:undecaprenyldiphospho-muramoylpentapeptide beta-N-acetylglucosaminyltransferase [Marinospirillum alkaliphilum]SFX03169.1 UDP-N-acetylglucosamine-N-acetylmuramylpentapeptide N-acetylglucosamine transferase [Marinospirillum alkaliphilum DSM 21637]